MTTETLAQVLLRVDAELPVFTVDLAAEHLGSSFEATNNAVSRLVEIDGSRP